MVCHHRFLKLPNNFVRFRLNHFYSFDFVRLLRNVIHSFKSKRFLRNQVNLLMIDGERRLRVEFDMLYCKWLLRNVFEV